MSDQASLPVTFPPGTELPIKGKVEVTGGKIEISNIPTVIVGNTQLRVVNGIGNILQVEIMNEPAVKVGNEPTVKVGNEPTVKVGGEVSAKITNVVKVEGLAASPVSIKNGGVSAEEVSVQQKRLLTTNGEKRLLKKTVGEATKYSIEFPASANSTWQLQSIFALWEETKVAEKSKVYLKIEVEDVTEKVLIALQTYFLNEVPGAGEKTMSFTVHLAKGNPAPILGAAATATVTNENNMWFTGALPEISGGIGVALIVKLTLLKASPLGTAIKTEGKTANSVYISNEGTL